MLYDHRLQIVSVKTPPRKHAPNEKTFLGTLSLALSLRNPMVGPLLSIFSARFFNLYYSFLPRISVQFSFYDKLISI